MSDINCWLLSHLHKSWAKLFFSFGQEQRQNSMSQAVYLTFAERSASQTKIRESQMSLQIIHRNKCDWNLPLKTDIFVFKFFHYLAGQFWAKSSLSRYKKKKPRHKMHTSAKINCS
jgi:hypothetical protein